MKVVIVDYGLGNLWSVRNAFEFMGADVIISSDPSLVSGGECLVLPGVGNFKSGMRNLHSRGLVAALNEAVQGRRVPLLGICLGMQLFADESEEAPGVQGLGWVPGRVLKFQDRTLRMPHVGFNSVVACSGDTNFFSQVDGHAPNFYFVHSYCFHPTSDKDVLARTNYGSDFVSAVQKDRVIGVQFHPEKSQSSGLRLISEFLRFSADGSNG